MCLPRSPYPLREFVGMVRRRFSPPPPRDSQPARERLVLTPNRMPDTWIGCVGDICPLGRRKARYDPAVKAFFADCDLLVGNFEGVITDQWRLPFLLKHTPSIFKALSQLQPLDRWVLTVANNHAIDFGERALYHTIAHFEERGIRWAGTRERPRLTLLDGVTLTAWTWWVNGTTKVVPQDDPGPPSAPGLHVAWPHWGYEHERTPRPSQRRQVPAGYDIIIGHHSHLPQPLERLKDGRPVAWSLGNFLTSKRLPVLGEGALLKLGLASNDAGPPTVVEVHYQAIMLDRGDRTYCRVHPRM